MKSSIKSSVVAGVVVYGVATTASASVSTEHHVNATKASNNTDTEQSQPATQLRLQKIEEEIAAGRTGRKMRHINPDSLIELLNDLLDPKGGEESVNS